MFHVVTKKKKKDISYRRREPFSQTIKASLMVLLLGVGIASVTDLQLNLLGSIIAVLTIAATCVGQIVSLCLLF